MSNRETFSSRERAEQEEKLIGEICRYRSLGEKPSEIYEKVTVECTLGKLSALVDKYDYLCGWVKEVRELFEPNDEM